MWISSNIAPRVTTHSAVLDRHGITRAQEQMVEWLAYYLNTTEIVGYGVQVTFANCQAHCSVSPSQTWETTAISTQELVEC